VAQQPAYEPRNTAPTTPTTRPVAAPPLTTATRTRPSYGGLAARIVMTMLGVAGLIIGAFLHAADGIMGTDVPFKALWTTDMSGSTFIQSLGFAMIVVGLVAVVGIALRTGVLTSLAGALGIAGVILFLVTVNRVDGNLNGVDSGTWFWGVGALLCLIGGFFGARREVVETSSATPAIAP
jgi:hypothetical protein